MSTKPPRTANGVGLLNHGDRTASVRATGDVELLRLDRDTFRNVVEGSQATAEQLYRIATQREARTTTPPTGGQALPPR